MQHTLRRGDRSSARAPEADPRAPLVQARARRGRQCGELGLRGGREFDSIDDQTIYREHPVHQRVMTDLIAPIRADRAAVQYDGG
jgi:hypothetical protein